MLSHVGGPAGGPRPGRPRPGFQVPSESLIMCPGRARHRATAALRLYIYITRLV
jgi:hypothetical protein